MVPQKGTTKQFSYLTWQVSKSWHMPNGVFHTKGRGNFTLNFFEYSNSKEFSIEPDEVEYEKDEMKPVLDLILGIKSMYELGIILDCKNKMTTIDEITLPMRNIHSLTKYKVKSALVDNTLLSQERKAQRKLLNV